MNALRFTKVLPVLAFALVLPAWAIAPSDQAKTNTTTGSDQATQQPGSEATANTQRDTMDTGKTQDKHSAGKQKGHGPTATMDRATPVEKSDKGDSSAKHPPTARMDRTTPDQKSPGNEASGNETPSTAAK